MLYFVCFVCLIRKVHSHRHSTDNSPVAPPQRKASGPGSTAVTLSLSFRWSHGLNTNLPSPSRLSFRHCSFSMSMRWYSPYSRPLSAGSCSPAQPQPCPWPCPCPDIVEVRAGRKTSPPVLGQKTVRPDHDTSKSETVLCVQWLPCGVAVENDTSCLHIFKIKQSYTNDERGFLSKAAQFCWHFRKSFSGEHNPNQFPKTHFCFLFIPISINCPYLESVCA